MSQEPGQETPREGGNPHTAFFGTKTLIVLAFIIGVLVALIVAGSGIIAPSGTATLSPTACGEKTVQYINAHQITPGNTATLAGVRDYRGVYAVDIIYSSQNITVYATRDCSLLFADGINMSTSSTGSSTQAAANKSARPEVDLYVMSFCPYGYAGRDRHEAGG